MKQNEEEKERLFRLTLTDSACEILMKESGNAGVTATEAVKKLLNGLLKEFVTFSGEKKTLFRYLLTEGHEVENFLKLIQERQYLNHHPEDKVSEWAIVKLKESWERAFDINFEINHKKEEKNLLQYLLQNGYDVESFLQIYNKFDYFHKYKNELALNDEDELELDWIKKEYQNYLDGFCGFLGKDNPPDMENQIRICRKWLFEKRQLLQ